jgi:hypothetical protein
VDLDYVVHISRGPDNVDSRAIEADSDPQAFDLAIAWAASLVVKIKRLNPSLHR